MPLLLNDLLILQSPVIALPRCVFVAISWLIDIFHLPFDAEDH
jgi:hypothetical protein